MLRTYLTSSRNHLVVLVAGALLLSCRLAAADTVSYDFTITPTVNLEDVYVVNFVSSGDIFLDKVADSIAANTTKVVTGSDSFDAYGSPAASFSAGATVLAVYQNAQGGDGLSVGYSSTNAAGITAASATGVDTSFTNADQIGVPNSIPGYDPTTIAADPTSVGVVRIDTDNSEAEIIQDLQNGLTSGAAYVFSTNIVNAYDQVIEFDSRTNPTVGLLNFSNATDGGTATVVQTISDSSPVAAPLPKPVLASVALLGLIGVGQIRSRRAIA